MAEKKPKGKKTGEFREEAKLGVSDEYSKLRETRSLELKKNLNTRLSRMEGQMKGVRQMVENDRYYVDLVVQGISLISAMKSFCRIVMEEHLKDDVANELRAGEADASLDEFAQMLQKVMS